MSENRTHSPDESERANAGLATRVCELVRACCSGLWIESHEHEDALRELAELAAAQDWTLAVWSAESGLRGAGADPLGAAAGDGPEDADEAADPLVAVRALTQLADGRRPVLLVLVNLHRFLHRAELVQALAEHIGWGKRQRATLVVLAPVVDVPVELQRLLVVIEHPLPDREQLRQIGREIATEPGEWPEGEQEMAVLDAASGLTRLEAENAFSLALVRHGRVAAEAVWELKTAALRTGGLLQVWRAKDGFDALGGLGALKAFCRRSLLCSSRDDRDRRARGVLLLGVPGTGKSAFARALGHETGRPTLFLDVGALMGSLVGQTEQNVRRALQTADAMAPCILFVDELEKALSGAMTSGRTDSGVTARLFGTLLTWLSEHTSDVYFVGTCNDVSKLPPEFSRAERFDAVFFLDLPGRTAKDAIWELYQRRFGLPEQPRPDDTDWTGAEIRACCRLAALLDLPLTAAAQNVVPVAVTAADAVEQLRRWADGRCLDAERPGRYRRPERLENNAPGTPSARRRPTRRR
ncbi:MAG: AAA family ATPase [Planctomycetota bacterium]|nr:MAG: AAA family ATPase [Planctomycetota bacterium]